MWSNSWHAILSRSGLRGDSFLKLVVYGDDVVRYVVFDGLLCGA